MTMLAALVLGTGLPTTPSYILLTALLIPAIMKLGVIEPAAHMFAFYFAVLSAITPPVALAVFAAAGLAKADMWDSGWAAMKIGAAGFIVPFMFVYQPALLMIGDLARDHPGVRHLVDRHRVVRRRAARLFRQPRHPTGSARCWSRAACAWCSPASGTISPVSALAGIVVGVQWTGRRRSVARRPSPSRSSPLHNRGISAAATAVRRRQRHP